MYDQQNCLLTVMICNMTNHIASLLFYCLHQQWWQHQPFLRNVRPIPHSLKRIARHLLTSGASLSSQTRASHSHTITHTWDAHSESALAESINDAAKLLDLRKSYHKLSHQNQQANHHKQFLVNCLEIIPEGLRIKASCTGVRELSNNELQDMLRALIKMLLKQYAIIS